MRDRTVPSIPDLIAAHRPGHSLPAGFYTRADVFAADLEAVFYRQWIYAGIEMDVPDAGDVSVIDFGAASVAIIRGDDDVVRAFHNTCRHRGARLLPAGKTTVGKLTCPYHQWTYDLDGGLFHSRHMGQDFESSCHGLKPVHLRSIAGLLFLCFADEPPTDIDDLAAVLEPRLASYDLRNSKIAFEADLIEEGNWKLVIENNRECYHCTGTHPELCNSFIPLDFGYDPAALSPEEAAEAEAHEANNERKTADWEAMGYPSRAVEHLSGHETNFRTQRLIISGGGESQTMTGKAACRKLLGPAGRTDLGDVHIWTHNSWHHVMGDHALTFIVIPLSEGRTLVRSKWLVHKDAVEGVDYDLETLTEVWQATNAQDAELVGLTQRGVSSLGYQPSRYSRFTEGQLVDFSVWYMERLAAAGYAGGLCDVG